MRREWLFILAGAVVLLLFAGKTFARPYRDESGNVIFPGNESDMIPVTNYSDNAVALVKREEGLRLDAYRDAGGWSIGYGHFLGMEKTIANITQDTAESYLAQDMDNAAQLIRDNVTSPLSQNQFDALTSFLYNLGSKALTGGDGGPSTWLTKLNAGDYEGASAQLTRWANSEGRLNNVLVQRREREKELFLSA